MKAKAKDLKQTINTVSGLTGATIIGIKNDGSIRAEMEGTYAKFLVPGASATGESKTCWIGMETLIPLLSAGDVELTPTTKTLLVQSARAKATLNAVDYDPSVKFKMEGGDKMTAKEQKRVLEMGRKTMLSDVYGVGVEPMLHIHSTKSHLVVGRYDMYHMALAVTKPIKARMSTQISSYLLAQVSSWSESAIELNIQDSGTQIRSDMLEYQSPALAPPQVAIDVPLELALQKTKPIGLATVNIDELLALLYQSFHLFDKAGGLDLAVTDDGISLKASNEFGKYSAVCSATKTMMFKTKINPMLAYDTLQNMKGKKAQLMFTENICWLRITDEDIDYHYGFLYSN